MVLILARRDAAQESAFVCASGLPHSAVVPGTGFPYWGVASFEPPQAMDPKGSPEDYGWVIGDWPARGT
eukprot:7199136-Lingulodinium_polyedra.AAC.1